MKKMTSTGLVIALLGFAGAAGADTRKISWTQYHVGLDAGEVVAPLNASKVRIGMRTHLLLVDASGVTRSGWCTQQEQLTAAEEPVEGAGYCAIYEDNGDVFYVGFTYKAMQPSSWIVLGGTGQYEGATGSGTTAFVSQRGGGGAWTFKSEGSLTTK